MRFEIVLHSLAKKLLSDPALPHQPIPPLPARHILHPPRTTLDMDARNAVSQLEMIATRQRKCIVSSHLSRSHRADDPLISQ